MPKKSKVRLKKLDPKDPDNLYIVESGIEDKEENIKVKCPKCGTEEVLTDLGGWFYIIMKHTICRVCGAKIEMEEKYGKKDNDWLNAILNMPHQSKVMEHTNASCVKCDAIERHMVRVGAIIMCPKCFSETFHTEFPVSEEREEYLKWLKISQSKED